MEIIVQHGTIGLNSPKIATSGVVVITRGVMSRTGRVMGAVDQGLCVQVTAYGPMGEDGEREAISTERLYAADRWDPSARSRIGTAGAFVDQEPAEGAVAAAVERARVRLESGTPANALRVTHVEPKSDQTT